MSEDKRQRRKQAKDNRDFLKRILENDRSATNPKVAASIQQAIDDADEVVQILSKQIHEEGL